MALETIEDASTVMALFERASQTPNPLTNY